MRKRYLSMAKSGALFVALALCPVDKAQAASFDCGKAATKVEKMICGDEELSKLDDKLGKVYQDVMSKANDAEKQRLLTG